MSQPASQQYRNSVLKMQPNIQDALCSRPKVHAKRRSKAQMITDRQRELEEKEASEQAIQQGHQHIATLQEQMATDQAAAPRPIKKGAKPSATSELSMANGEAGAEVTADKVVGTKGKQWQVWSQTPTKKFNLAGRIPDWRSNLPTSKAAPSTTPSVQCAPPLTPQGTSDPDDGTIIRHSHLYEDEEDDDESNEYGFASGAQVKASVEEDVQPYPSAHPIPLVNYTSNSDTDFETPLSGQASHADRDAYIEFPSLAQPPSTRYVPPKEDLLSPSSEVEVLAVVKKEPEAVTLRRTSATSVTVKPKAPVTEEVEVLCCKYSLSAQALRPPRQQRRHQSQSGKWSGVFIPTLIYCIGNQDEVWAIKDSPLRATLQLIWDAVYKGVPYTVTTDRACHCQWPFSSCQNGATASAPLPLVVFANFLRSQADLETE
ncbi:hypothetical protein F4604DRAFT_1931778 [Suillus subluteus]|nr:hypothetical protein F4604DRAFT_1931778 [Suillus subluteus]